MLISPSIVGWKSLQNALGSFLDVDIYENVKQISLCQMASEIFFIYVQWMGGPYFAFLKILKIAVHLLKDMYSGMPKIGLKKFLVKTQKSAGLSKIYLVNSLSVCNELTSKSQTRAADFCFLT